jgi:hypothetical protein
MTPDFEMNLLALLTSDTLYIFELEGFRRICYVGVEKKEACFVYF